jgi:hypothetical protein
VQATTYQAATRWWLGMRVDALSASLSLGVAIRAANSGGPGDRPAPLASRLHGIHTFFLLNLYIGSNESHLPFAPLAERELSSQVAMFSVFNRQRLSPVTNQGC